MLTDRGVGGGSMCVSLSEGCDADRQGVGGECVCVSLSEGCDVDRQG